MVYISISLPKRKLSARCEKINSVPPKGEFDPGEILLEKKIGASTYHDFLFTSY